MKGDLSALRASAKMLAPILGLLAFAILGNGGAGLAAGALLGVTLMLHTIVFGTEAAQRAIAHFALRLVAALALAALIVAACNPHWAYTPLLAQAAVCAAAACALGLAFTTLAARVPSLRDGDWG